MTLMLFIIGLAALVAGCLMISWALGLIVGGVTVVAIAWSLDRADEASA